MVRSRVVSYLLISAIVFTLLSLPFLTGMMRPTMAERNPYALFYSFLNFPVTYVLKDLIVSVAEIFWESPSTDQMDLIGIVFSGIFWSIVGSVVGFIVDLRSGQGT